MRPDPAPVRRPPPGAGRAAWGSYGEDVAARALEAAGLEILARNWRVALPGLRGELDLVARDPADGTLVVCEVKTRRGIGFGAPLAAVTDDKQARIRALTRALLREGGIAAPQVRFDVVGVLAEPGRATVVEHVRGAF